MSCFSPSFFLMTTPTAPQKARGFLASSFLCNLWFLLWRRFVQEQQLCRANLKSMHTFTWRINGANESTVPVRLTEAIKNSKQNGTHPKVAFSSNCGLSFAQWSGWCQERSSCGIPRPLRQRRGPAAVAGVGYSYPVRPCLTPVLTIDIGDRALKHFLLVCSLQSLLLSEQSLRLPAYSVWSLLRSICFFRSRVPISAFYPCVSEATIGNLQPVDFDPCRHVGHHLVH